MSKNYIEDKTFEGRDFKLEKLEDGDYENCRFNNCNLANTNLSNISFMESTFEQCDLSMAKVGNTAFKDIRFIKCKLLGVHFEDCNPFLLAMKFDGCQLDLASFYKLSLKNTEWKNCHLKEADFNESDLTAASFGGCDLSGAVFRNSVLEKADFRGAINYSIDPEANNIKKAKFSIPEVAGLLDKYNIVIE